jgi:nitrite reductase/ring-hydroxylating ferredoxin subunit
VEFDGSEQVTEVLVLRRGRRFVAVMNRCPHLGLTIEDAMVRGTQLVCQGHGRRYSLRRKQVPNAARALTEVPFHSEGDGLLIDVSGLTS